MSAMTATRGMLSVSELTPVFAPLNNVNDETILIVEVRCKDGEAVQKEAVLLIAETSKATFEITAPAAGFIRLLVRPGQEIPIGDALCLLADSPDKLPAPGAAAPAQLPQAAGEKTLASSGSPPAPPAATTVVASPPATAEPEPPKSRRFSQKAKELIEAEGLDPAGFDKHGLVRSGDVLKKLGQTPTTVLPERILASAAAGNELSPAVGGVPFREVPLSKSKRTEIALLAEARAAAVTSQVSVLVPSEGVFTACARNAAFAGQMSSRIIFEAARVLRAFPMLNAGYRPGHSVQYDQINIGYALDIEHGLKVPVIHGADAAPLEEIHQRKQALVEKYLLNTLTVDDLSRGTFTITDLSSEDCWLFNPIVNKGQAAILGVTGEYAAGGAKPVYGLVLAFDHRLAEGLVASRFLAELKRRLTAHHAVLLRLLGGESEKPQEACCAECFRPASEITSLGGHLLKSVHHDGKDRLVCSVCVAGH
jgi:pyruvate/2-oxoglutarate dehydrogenase complex dihydrolipoamide acyltransferase (E2) component